MATPKKRHSGGRGRKRRANWNLDTVQVNRCQETGLPKLPHRICEESGFYGKGRKVMQVEERL